jgi:hypothetical protein
MNDKHTPFVDLTSYAKGLREEAERADSLPLKEALWERAEYYERLGKRAQPGPLDQHVEDLRRREEREQDPFFKQGMKLVLEDHGQRCRLAALSGAEATERGKLLAEQLADLRRRVGLEHDPFVKRRYQEHVAMLQAKREPEGPRQAESENSPPARRTSASAASSQRTTFNSRTSATEGCSENARPPASWPASGTNRGWNKYKNPVWWILTVAGLLPLLLLLWALASRLGGLGPDPDPF